MTAVTVRIWKEIGVTVGTGGEIYGEGEVIPRLIVTNPVMMVPPMEMRLKPGRFPSSSELDSRSLMARVHGSPGGLH